MKTFRRPEQGFTLLELLVVLVVLGLLAGIVAPKYFNQLGKSETKVARAQIEGLVKALDIYRLEVGRYPSTEQGLSALVTAPTVDACSVSVISRPSILPMSARRGSSATGYSPTSAPLRSTVIRSDTA